MSILSALTGADLLSSLARGLLWEPDEDETPTPVQTQFEVWWYASGRPAEAVVYRSEEAAYRRRDELKALGHMAVVREPAPERVSCAHS
jgi:hypothetical protein